MWKICRVAAEVATWPWVGGDTGMVGDGGKGVFVLLGAAAAAIGLLATVVGVAEAT